MGIAYLPDGSRIDYDEYIKSHPHWQKVRMARFNFDNGCCVICHKDLTDKVYQTHHNNYDHLGNEHIRDVLTMCPGCHTVFHNNWQRQRYWKGHEPNHWQVFNLHHTAKMCLMFLWFDIPFYSLTLICDRFFLFREEQKMNTLQYLKQ